MSSERAKMNTLSELHQDHINLTRLLDILERKVARLRDGVHPDFSLMADVVSYVGDYADQYHHPHEDIMYEFFRGRDAELDQRLSACEQEHQTLKQLSGTLSESIEAILNDAVVPMDRFTDQLDAFVSAEKRHLDFEEGEIFPRLDALASEADWQQLEQQIPRPADPLFGEHQAEQYRELYRALLEDMNREEEP